MRFLPVAADQERHLKCKSEKINNKMIINSPSFNRQSSTSNQFLVGFKESYCMGRQERLAPEGILDILTGFLLTLLAYLML